MTRTGHGSHRFIHKVGGTRRDWTQLSGPLCNSWASRWRLGDRPVASELERVLDHLRAVEPLLRKTADQEIRTDKPLSHVVSEVVRLSSA